MTYPDFRDVEQLSAYLDGKLSQADVTRLEAKIQNDPALASTVEALRQSRALLRRLPQRRVPRNFTLTRAQAGVKAPAPRSAPFFQWASALATLLLIFGFAANTAVPLLDAQQATTPLMMGMGGGCEGPGCGDTEMAAELAPEASVEAPPEERTAKEPEMPACPIPEGWIEHVVIEGDTLIGLSQQYGVTVADLQTSNCLYSTTIVLGQSVYVPAEAVWTPAQPPIPVAVLIGLLILAILAGALALYLRWDAERKFKEKNK